MQKKKITAFLLALAMVSAMALPVFAQEPNPQAETAASIAVVRRRLGTASDPLRFQQ